MADPSHPVARYFPVSLRLDGARVVVVGGGEIAARKIRLLLRAEPRIDVVAQALNAEVEAMAASGSVIHRAENFDPSQLDGARVVVAADDDHSRPIKT